MPLIKYAARLLGVALTATTLVACGTSNERPASAPSTEAADTETRTVVDMTGRSVQIPTKVDRVATNFPALNQMIFMLGDADRIVATSKDMQKNYPLFTTMYPRLKEIPAPFDSGSANANVEEVLAARPDVVFLSAGAKGLLPAMDRLHIPTRSSTRSRTPKN
jgi:iron complex transport system substrate-binding protein